MIAAPVPAHFARAVLLFALLATLTANASNNTAEWRFRVSLDDTDIGYHVFRLSAAGTEQELTSEARYDVKFLYIPVYHYMHDSRERWQGNCLRQVEAKTEDNGTALRVRGAQDGQHFVVTGQAGSAMLPDCVMTFAYWNPELLTQTRMLNVQTGEYLDVKVQSLGEETIVVRGLNQRARRYALETSKFRIDLWYSPQREWLALESRTDGGRLLRYRIQ